MTSRCDYGDARFGSLAQAEYVAEGLSGEFDGTNWDAVEHGDHWHVHERPSHGMFFGDQSPDARIRSSGDAGLKERSGS